MAPGERRRALCGPEAPARIVSGGQSGADRGALLVARSLGIPLGGWCPAGGWAEDLPDPPGVRVEFPELTEAPTADPAQRTELNVRDSDATLILAVASDLTPSPGTGLTRALARELGRPVAVVDPQSPAAADRVRALLTDLAGGVLNVAGPRESESPGLQAATQRLLLDVLSPF